MPINRVNFFAGIKKTTSWLLLVSGFFFVTSCILAFTTAPFWMYFDLGTRSASYTFTPAHIIVLGGSGMPSESNLMRCYTTSQVALKYSSADIIIALPKDSAVQLYRSALYAMKSELICRGVDSTRIILEPFGHNTREQALEILGKTIHHNEPTLIVTSPEHMYRSLLTFRKAGLTQVGGVAAFEKALESELTYNSHRLGGRKLPVPEVGDELQLRYQFWNHLRYQVICYREYAALLYYHLKDWI